MSVSHLPHTFLVDHPLPLSHLTTHSSAAVNSVEMNINILTMDLVLKKLKVVKEAEATIMILKDSMD